MARQSISPFRDLLALGAVMDRYLDGGWSSSNGVPVGAASQSLPLDVYETSEDFVVRAHVPGVKPEDIDIELEHGVLTLRTKSTPPDLPQGANWLLMEVPSGQAARQVTLPRSIDADQASTTFENGVLTLTLPKTADSKPRQIRVGATREIGAGRTG